MSTRPEDDGSMTEAELRALLDAAIDGIVVSDEQGRILAFNKAAERIFGRSSAEVVGAGVEVRMPEPDRSRHAAYMRRYIEHGGAKIIGIGREVNAIRASGEVFPIALSVGEARTRGRRRFVAIIRDLSAERAAELRARGLESRLAHVDRFNIMGELAAGIAHEINQPLSAIATYAQAARRLLQRETINRDALDDIWAKIDVQARRAGQVIDNVRNFIRRREQRTGPLDLNRVIADVRELMEADARAAGIEINMRLASDLPLVHGDGAQLQHLLLNLTRNAVDAMRGMAERRGGIVVETELAANGKVRVGVTDHGPGVPEWLGQSIFHPFVTTKSSGLGVGLAISRTIAQAFGGTLDYTNNPEGGAVFSLELPAVGEEEAREG